MTNVRQIGDIPFLQISVMYVELIPQLFENPDNIAIKNANTTQRAREAAKKLTAGSRPAPFKLDEGDLSQLKSLLSEQLEQAE